MDTLAVAAGVSYVNREADSQQLRLTLFFNPVYATGAVTLAADLTVLSRMRPDRNPGSQ